MRRPVIAGNWKMYKTQAETRAFFAAFKPLVANANHCDIVIAPPATALAAAVDAAKGSSVSIYGQNLHWEKEGAFTGEVSAKMLLEAGCKGTIIGHSEWRHVFGESDDAVAKKLRAALEAVERKRLAIGAEHEDAHSAVEAWLTQREPGAGERLHTGRSRNDQIACDIRLLLKDRLLAVQQEALDLTASYLKRAGNEAATRLMGAQSLGGGKAELIESLRNEMRESAALCECLIDLFDGIAESLSIETEWDCRLYLKGQGVDRGEELYCEVPDDGPGTEWRGGSWRIHGAGAVGEPLRREPVHRRPDCHRPVVRSACHRRAGTGIPALR